jgi:peptide deformylase
MSRFAVSVFGRDRPGIVAAVTRVLADAGCNLEDTSMTILRGHFAMMLVISGGAGIFARDLQARLSPVADRLDLQLSVRSVSDDVTTAQVSGERWSAAVYAADQPGLVARVSEVLAGYQVNIVGLETRLVGEPDAVYVMHFELEVPAGRAGQVQSDLAAAARARRRGEHAPRRARRAVVAVRPVLRLPAPQLKMVAKPVARLDQPAQQVANDLVDTMGTYDHCVGLAAPQIGVGLRVFAMDVSGHPKARSCHGLVVLFNPEVLLATESKVAREGCMSVPDLTGNVLRPSRVVIRGMTSKGSIRVIEADALEARALLPELDHLDGLLFLDRVAAPHTDLFQRRTYR